MVINEFDAEGLPGFAIEMHRSIRVGGVASSVQLISAFQFVLALLKFSYL
jgi:hypothetical protein